ncbi:MAG: hypothetical protein MRJ68_15940 [Nitrospira sp.]|nr:hypothetical protein [Nitrospira sp.]
MAHRSSGVLALFRYESGINQLLATRHNLAYLFVITIAPPVAGIPTCVPDLR